MYTHTTTSVITGTITPGDGTLLDIIATQVPQGPYKKYWLIYLPDYHRAHIFYPGDCVSYWYVVEKLAPLQGTLTDKAITAICNTIAELIGGTTAS